MVVFFFSVNTPANTADIVKILSTRQSGDSAEDTKTISNNAMFNSMKDVEATIVAGMYAVAYQYTWSFDGVRAQDVVQVAAGDNLALQLVASSKTMSLPTKFKSVVNVAVK